MKVKKLLETLSGLLDSDRREQLKRYDDIKEVMKKLKRKRDQLLDELESADESARDEILQRLDIVVGERRKGIALLRELKQVREGRKED
jgi:hypothetical protein